MKKVLPLLFLILFGTTVPSLEAKTSRAHLVSEVDSCWAILQEIMSDPATAIPPAVWQRAHAVVIVNQFKAGFIFGLKGGYGVILVKKPGGHWSVPVLLSADEASLGFQIGAKSVESVNIITDDQTPRLLFRKRYNLGFNAKAVAGPHAAEAESVNHTLLTDPVYVYTKSSGLYAGATVNAAEVARNDEDNFVLYNTNYSMPELLYSDWVQAPTDVQPLMSYLERLAP